MSASTDLDLLFDPSLIPSASQQILGEDLRIRPLASSDDQRGLFDLLSVLTVAPQLSPTSFSSIFEYYRSCPKTYFIVVIVHKPTDQIVACGTVMIERKLIRGGGIIGHIEDIAVARSMQGRKLGIRIINTLEEIGRQIGCYKIILDCSQSNIPFYEKCGFTHKEFQMVRYMEDPAGAPKSTESSKL